jgi:hypothetical protein
MEQQRKDADKTFSNCIPEQKITPARRSLAADSGTDGHAAHEYGQHQSLRIGGMAQKQLKVMCPNRFVDQAGEAGNREDQEVGSQARHWVRMRVRAGLNDNG